MATISKIPTYIVGLPRFEKRVCYSARTKKFSIPLPDFMAGPLGLEEVTADSQDAVEKLFAEKVEEVKTIQSTVTKVIVYQFSYRVTDGVSLELKAGVANERVSDVDGRKSYVYEQVPSSLGEYPHPNQSGGGRHQLNTVPWTEERERAIGEAIAGVKQAVQRIVVMGTVKEDRWGPSNIILEAEKIRGVNLA